MVITATTTRHVAAIAALLLFVLPTVVTSFLSPAIILRTRRVDSFGLTANRYTNNDLDISSAPPIANGRAQPQPQVEPGELSSAYDQASSLNGYHLPLPVSDPALVEFVSPESYLAQATTEDAATDRVAAMAQATSAGYFYPFAAMMQGSAPYIAAHAGQIAVVHLPGDLILESSSTARASAKNLFSDMALAWLLGIKLVIVVGCSYDLDRCDVDQPAHECHNTLRVTDKQAMRRTEEEAGLLRVEVERNLNRLLRMHSGVSNSKDACSANVMSGAFYSAQRFGTIRGTDFEYSGICSKVHNENIRNVLASNDVVLLTTVGLSRTGDLVNVNGYHLAASVAISLQANKLIYLSQRGSVLQKKNAKTPIQEMPVSFAQALLDYHSIKVHDKTGFATFERARQSLDPGAVEMLLNMAWATWAVQTGSVQRAHVVNPTDGALLEELFTSTHGVNACIYHDDEHAERGPEVEISQHDWDAFFSDAAAQGQDVPP